MHSSITQLHFSSAGSQGVGPVLAGAVQESKYNYQMNLLKLMNVATFLRRIPSLRQP